MRKLNILIVGVGGQGTLLASRVIGQLADNWGKDCKLSEVHGMAQRGGSVVTHARISDKVLSPILCEGEADIIIAFERLEALRWRHYLKADGLLIFNNQEIYPMPVIIGDREYPENIEETFKKENINFISVDALNIAENLGNAKALNTVMMGVFAKAMDISYEDIYKSVVNVVPAKALAVNESALKLGYYEV